MLADVTPGMSPEHTGQNLIVGTVYVVSIVSLAAVLAVIARTYRPYRGC